MEVLAKSNFENCEGDTKQGESHEVWDEESSTTVLDGETGKSPYVTESYGSSDRSHVKGKTRRPLTAIFGFVELDSIATCHDDLVWSNEL